MPLKSSAFCAMRSRSKRKLLSVSYCEDCALTFMSDRLILCRMRLSYSGDE